MDGLEVMPVRASSRMRRSRSPLWTMVRSMKSSQMATPASCSCCSLLGIVCVLLAISNVLDAEYPPLSIIRQIQLSVLALRQSHRPAAERGRFAVGVDESVDHGLEVSRRAAICHRLIHDPVATGRQRRAIPRPVENDECAIAIPPWQLRPGVEEQAVRRPVPWEESHVARLSLATPNRGAIATV